MHIKTYNNKMHIDENTKSDTNAISLLPLFVFYAAFHLNKLFIWISFLCFATHRTRFFLQFESNSFAITDRRAASCGALVKERVMKIKFRNERMKMNLHFNLNGSFWKNWTMKHLVT